MTTPAAKELADLARRARDGGLDLSQVSLRVMTDLLLGAPQPRREDLDAFRDIATALVPGIDEATAIVLARKLAGWPHAPAAVLGALRVRGGAVLVELVRHGLPLTPAEIESFADSGDPELMGALARRRDLTTSASILLVQAGSEAIDLALIGNSEAPLPRAASDVLVARSRRRPAYRPGLLARNDLSNLELAPLFLHAGAERRLSILDSLAAHEALHPTERRPALPEAEFAGWLTLAGEDHGAAFAAVSEAVDGGPALAEAMMRDATRELATLALVGAGARPEEATRFLIRLGDEAAHSVESLFALVALMRSIRPAIARRLALQIAGSAAPPTARRGQHQPAMDPSGTPGRAGTARPEGQRSMTEMLGRIGPRRERS